MEKSNALIQAAEHYDINTAQRLLTTVKVNINAQGGSCKATALYYAAKQGCVELVDLLLDKKCMVDIGSADNVTPFLIASAHGHTYICQRLQESGCSTTRSDPEGRTAVHLAAIHGHIHTLKYLVEGLGLEKNQRDALGHTPLHLSVIHNQTRSLGYLVKCRADINSYSHTGATPLWSACHLGIVYIAKILIHEILLHGRKYWLDEIDKEGRSSVYEAVCGKHTEIVHYLVNAGADINVTKAREGKKSLTGESPLLRAIRHGDMTCIQTLLKAKGCDVDVPFKGENVTPLHFAVILDCQLSKQWRDDPVMTEQLGSCPITYIQIINLLLPLKPNLDTLDETHHTPLITACSHGNLAVAKLLCQHGAEVNKKCKKSFQRENEAGKFYMSAIEMALYKDHVETVKFLVEQKAQFIISDWMDVPELRVKLENNPILLEWIKLNRK